MESIEWNFWCGGGKTPQLNWLPTGIINLIKHCMAYVKNARINHTYIETAYSLHTLARSPTLPRKHTKFQLKLLKFFDR